MKYFVCVILLVFLISCSFYDESENNLNVDPISDEELCRFLYSSINAVFKDELNFLCDSSGFRKLGEKENVIIKDVELGSKLIYSAGGYFSVKANLESAKNMYYQFCYDFPRFMEISPEAFINVKNVLTSNISNSGCDFHFIGKKVLYIFKPEFLGHVDYFETDKVFVFSQHLTESISLIEDAKSLSISVVNGNFIDIYSVSYSYSDTKGFHKNAKEKMLESAQAMRGGIISHINEF